MTAAKRRDPKCPPKLLRARIAELEAEVARLRTGSKHPKGWTDLEDAIVRHGYERQFKLATIRGELIAKGHRPRSLGAISGRAQQLGLASPFAANAWTEPEDTILRVGYAEGVTFAEIRRSLLAAGFNRRRSAIGMRAVALGISGERVNFWGDGETRIALAGLKAGKLFRDIEADLARSGFSRSKGALTKFARRHGLSRPPEPWSAGQITALRAGYAAGLSIGRLAAELGKSPGAVASKANVLGLRQRELRRKAAA